MLWMFNGYEFSWLSAVSVQALIPTGCALLWISDAESHTRHFWTDGDLRHRPDNPKTLPYPRVEDDRRERQHQQPLTVCLELDVSNFPTTNTTVTKKE